MKLEVTGIDHVNMTVKNLDETCKFWYDLLEFKTLEDIPQEKGRIIGNKFAMLTLYENPNFGGYQKRGFNHLSFHISNFEDAQSKLKEMGITIEYGGIINWSKSQSIYFNDPNGYEIELAKVWGGGLVEI